MNLQRMKQLAGIKLNESVAAVPGIDMNNKRKLRESSSDVELMTIPNPAFDASDMNSPEEIDVAVRYSVSGEYVPARINYDDRDHPEEQPELDIESIVDEHDNDISGSIDSDTLEHIKDKLWDHINSQEPDYDEPDFGGDDFYEAAGAENFDTYPGQPKPSYEGKSREELEARLAKLQAEFDPGFEYSDDHSFWKRQTAIKKHIAAIEQALAGLNEDESDMQTAATVASNQGDIGFDMAQEGYKVMPGIDRDRYQERPGLEGPFTASNGKVVYYDPKEGSYYDPDSDIYMDKDFTLDESLQNGYDSKKYANGEDYFPNGADGPVVKATGPSGAKQGDNPEQKKMQVAETHKELVYAYRSFLKESANTKKKIV